MVVPVLITGSMDLVEIGNRQAGWFYNWYIFHDPFIFVTFWIYVTCAVASTNRAPFDLPEAESELVAGFLTEYSGFRWVIFFMAEYAAMFVVSGLGSVLFLGGWNGPIPVASLLGLAGDPNTVAGWLGNLLGLGNFIIKAVIGVTCMIWLRWTLPRLRIDQVMTTCLKYCVPLASAMLAGAMLWTFFLPGGLIAQVRKSVTAVEQPRQAGPLSQRARGEELCPLSQRARAQTGPLSQRARAQTGPLSLRERVRVRADGPKDILLAGTYLPGPHPLPLSQRARGEELRPLSLWAWGVDGNVQFAACNLPHPSPARSEHDQVGR